MFPTGFQSSESVPQLFQKATMKNNIKNIWPTMIPTHMASIQHKKQPKKYHNIFV
jgi:hypothetical protein